MPGMLYEKNDILHLTRICSICAVPDTGSQAPVWIPDTFEGRPYTYRHISWLGLSDQ